jgi:CubicO group peptidase (beta-lactamase class C family)
VHFLPLTLASLTVAQPPTAPQLDVLVKDTLTTWKVPGVAVAVVQNDRVLYVKGFGVRDLDAQAPVTPDTVFPLASCTKPLTTLALAMLVDEGTLSWDDPVRKHVPWFKLADPLADANVTLRDLLAHRTGIGRHDWLWYRSRDSLEGRVRKLAFLEPSHSFRSTFEYQPIAFGAAGLALEKAAKMSWAEFLEERLLRPLDMKSASAIFPKERADEVAAPHRKGAKGVEAIARYPLDEPDPAGSAHASARDLAAFLRLQLREGVWQGKRLVSPETFFELHRPQMLIRREGFAQAINPHTRVLSYGLGWIVQDYRGVWLSMHGGAIEGFRAHLTLVPEARLGIAVLSNLDRSLMNLALSNLLVDRYCGFESKDWNGWFRAIEANDERRDREELAANLAKRHKGTKPSLPLAAYAGDFVDRAYGTCAVRLDEGKLTWRWGSLQAALEHFHFDTFVARPEGGLQAAVVFQLDSAGEVESLKVLERTFTRRKP